MQTAYKFLGSGGLSTFQSFEWATPKNGSPARWMPRIQGPLVLCENGYHLAATRRGLIKWMSNAAALYEAEWSLQSLGDTYEGKIAVRKARLIRRVKGFTVSNLREFGYRAIGHALTQAEDAGVKVADIREAFEKGKTNPKALKLYAWEDAEYEGQTDIDSARRGVRHYLLCALSYLHRSYLRSPYTTDRTAYVSCQIGDVSYYALDAVRTVTKFRYLSENPDTEYYAFYEHAGIREERWQGRALAECIGLKPRTPIKVKVSESDGSPSGQGSVSV